MSISRRSLIKAGAALGAAASAASAGSVTILSKPSLIIFDSRLPASRAFAARHSGPRIDVAHEDADFWRSLRSLSAQGSISGLTRWDDWVTVRGLLEEKGKRLRSETHEGGLFCWMMV